MGGDSDFFVGISGDRWIMIERDFWIFKYKVRFRIGVWFFGGKF